MTQDPQQNPYDDKEIDTRPAGERIKDDFSFVQVFTSILSAVTSMILAPKIGIIGGVLGVVIGAAVAATASQIYKSVLSASADKLKASSLKAEELTESQKQSQPADAHAASAPGISHTQVMNRPVASGSTEFNPYAAVARSSAQSPATGTPIAPVQLRAQAQRRQRRATVKMLIIVSLVALLAIFIYAAAVNFFTKGQGLGTKPEPIIITKPVQKPIADNTDLESQNQSKDQKDSKDQQDQDKQDQPKNKDNADDQGGPDDQGETSNNQNGSSTGDSSQQGTGNKQDQNGGGTGTDQSSSNTDKDKNIGNQDQGGTDAIIGGVSKN